MAIINPPAPLPLRNAKWRVPFPAQVNRSAWTGRRKVIGLPGAARWTLSAEFVTIVAEANAIKWRGFFIALSGPLNRFRVLATEAAQTTAANPVVAAGASFGGQLPMAGMTANATVLKAGQMMTVPLPSGHERLVCLTADLIANGAGQGVAYFGPELGEVPATGATVEIRRPWCLVALTSEPPGWDIEPGQQYQFRIDCEEAL